MVQICGGALYIRRKYRVYLRMNDSIVASVVQKFLQRSELGQQKYGTTLDRGDLTTLQWIQHAQDELMDGILYLEKLKTQVEGVGNNKTAN